MIECKYPKNTPPTQYPISLGSRNKCGSGLINFDMARERTKMPMCFEPVTSQSVKNINRSYIRARLKYAGINMLTVVQGCFIQQTRSTKMLVTFERIVVRAHRISCPLNFWTPPVPRVVSIRASGWFQKTVFHPLLTKYLVMKLSSSTFMGPTRPKKQYSTRSILA